jgi:hypothetical protein
MKIITKDVQSRIERSERMKSVARRKAVLDSELKREMT